MLLEDGEANPLVSRPSRGAWIETSRTMPATCAMPSRALHGARGLKQEKRTSTGYSQSVAPFTGRVD